MPGLVFMLDANFLNLRIDGGGLFQYLINAFAYCSEAKKTDG
jgi:hypothetical protein